MFELLSGIGLAAVTCFVLTLLPTDYARDLTAILLVLTASIYLGFSLASQGRLKFGKQAAGSILFIVIALLGLWVNWWFLAAGLVLHSVWDYIHHGDRGRGIVPGWYIPLCAGYDVSMGLFIALYFALET